MGLTSDSSGGARRNVFDVAAPVPAAPDGVTDPSGSIFAAPRAASAAFGCAHAQSRRRRLPAIPRLASARAVALLALACAAVALPSAVFVKRGEPELSTERQEERLGGKSESAARPTKPAQASRAPRQEARRSDAAARERRVRSRRQRARPRVGRSPRLGAAPTTAPSPVPPAPEIVPAPVPVPQPPAPVGPRVPERRLPAPVPAGAPPQFM